MTHLGPRLLDAMLERGIYPDEQAHLDRCDACRQELSHQRAVQAAIAAAAPPAASALHVRRQTLRFRRSLERRPVERRRRWRLALPLSATALAAAASVVLLWPHRPPGPRDAPGSEPLAQSTLARAVTSAAQPAQPSLDSAAGPGLAGDQPAVAVTLPAQILPARRPQKTPRRSARAAAKVLLPQAGPIVAAAKPTDPPPALVHSDGAPEAAARAERESGSLAASPALDKAAPEPRPGQTLSAQDVALAVAAATQAAFEDSGAAIEGAFARLSAARDPGQQRQHLLALQRLLISRSHSMEPAQLQLSAQRIASLALPSPQDETAAYLACELSLQSGHDEAAYRLCSTYLDRFPQGPHAREVAYLSGTVARTRLGDCRAAIQRYGQAITFSGLLRSYDDKAYLGRALCRAQLGDLEGARGDLDMYLHKRPLERQDAEVQGLILQLQSSLRR